MTSGAFFVFLHFGQHLLLGSLGQSSEVECNPKMNILFFNDLGGLFCFFTFQLMFFAWIAWLIIEVERNPKMNILFFDDLGGLFFVFLHFSQCFLLGLLGQSSEVERNPKLSILFFDDMGGLFWHFG